MQRSGAQDDMVNSSSAEAWYQQPGSFGQGLCLPGRCSQFGSARLQVVRRTQSRENPSVQQSLAVFSQAGLLCQPLCRCTDNCRTHNSEHCHKRSMRLWRFGAGIWGRGSTCCWEAEIQEVPQEGRQPEHGDRGPRDHLHVLAGILPLTHQEQREACGQQGRGHDGEEHQQQVTCIVAVDGWQGCVLS